MAGLPNCVHFYSCIFENVVHVFYRPTMWHIYYLSASHCPAFLFPCTWKRERTRAKILHDPDQCPNSIHRWVIFPEKWLERNGKRIFHVNYWFRALRLYLFSQERISNNSVGTRFDRRTSRYPFCAMRLHLFHPTETRSRDFVRGISA